MFESFSQGGDKFVLKFWSSHNLHSFLLMVVLESAIEVVDVEDGLKLKSCMNDFAWVFSWSWLTLELCPAMAKFGS